jgi:hypothetical protein
VIYLCGVLSFIVGFLLGAWVMHNKEDDCEYHIEIRRIAQENEI